MSKDVVKLIAEMVNRDEKKRWLSITTIQKSYE